MTDMTEAERCFRNLVARIDRDGGQMQQADATMAATAVRADAIVVALRSQEDDIDRMLEIANVLDHDESEEPTYSLSDRVGILMEQRDAAVFERDELLVKVDAARGVIDVLFELHHGRMPEKLQKVADAWRQVYADEAPARALDRDEVSMIGTLREYCAHGPARVDDSDAIVAAQAVCAAAERLDRIVRATRRKVEPEDDVAPVAFPEPGAATKALRRAREFVKRYIVAMGHHLSDSWRDGLIEECGLAVDSIGFVLVPPDAPEPVDPKASALWYACRDDDAGFRRLTRPHLKARHKLLSSDGYVLSTPPSPSPGHDLTTPWLRERGIVWRGSITDLETDVRRCVSKYFSEFIQRTREENAETEKRKKLVANLVCQRCGGPVAEVACPDENMACETLHFDCVDPQCPKKERR